MINLCCVFGPPLSGKSTLMLELMAQLPGLAVGSWGKVVFQGCAEKRVLVVGAYFQGETYGGVDRLPVDVGRQLQQFLATMAYTPGWDGYRVFMEGERIYSDGFLSYVTSKPGIETRLLGLRVDPTEMTRRALMRGDSLESAYHKSRITRFNNLVDNWRIPVYTATTEADRAILIGHALSPEFFKFDAEVPAAD